jgi:hypothetical protein
VAQTVPGKDATPEEWKAFYSGLGVPPDAAGYKLEVPEGHDPAFATKAAGWFHKANVTSEQASALTKEWNAEIASQVAAIEAQRVAAAKADDVTLRNEWQGSYDAELENGKKALREFFPGDKSKEVLDALESSIGYAATHRVLAKIGKGMGEGAMRGGEGAPPASAGGLAQQWSADLAKLGIGPKQPS